MNKIIIKNLNKNKINYKVLLLNMKILFQIYKILLKKNQL